MNSRDLSMLEMSRGVKLTFTKRKFYKTVKKPKRQVWGFPRLVDGVEPRAQNPITRVTLS